MFSFLVHCKSMEFLSQKLKTFQKILKDDKICHNSIYVIG